jgi:DNA mismatch repair protein MutS2
VPTFGVEAKGSKKKRAGAGQRPEVAGPKPLDLRVPAGKRVVAVTGPNTGGKTVCLKVAGLMALMAKAGLLLPVDADPGGPSPSLHWFDSVLADIGDSQSLQQSLSTFSGHVRRLRRVLGAAGPLSLVLLDEVGSGTDPGEGAALARAVLDALADRAGLTLATTHHAELRGVAGQDARYAAASMGFDTASLAPTYALTWGAVGASNALDIAQRLGFDAAVVGDARQLAANEEAAREAAAADMARVAVSVEQQLGETRARLERRRATHRAREEAVAALRRTEQELAALRGTVARGPALVSQVVARSVLELQLALAEFRRGKLEAAELAARLEALEALLPPRLRPGQQQQQQGGGGGGGYGLLEGVDLKPGDSVSVPKLGVFGEGTVVKVRRGAGVGCEDGLPLLKLHAEQHPPSCLDRRSLGTSSPSTSRCPACRAAAARSRCLSTRWCCRMTPGRPLRRRSKCSSNRRGMGTRAGATVPTATC